ncbi:hypothetical protein BV25DRAFT_1826026 [Artomyces pyxidatus]|uniref:Uncharacterized protein n=1 Tax=Artomyces pyxidatus TaxID=48021 RepID=A0ACB8T232_9AGAM|nr:hypothetical protein BV25DRAFT_1826026 [Artomyces pyxidatus]
MQSGYSSPKQRPRVPATPRHRLPQVDVGLFAESRDTPIRPASRQTILSVQKSVFSQYSSKSRKNFHHTSPGQPMLR